MNSDAFNKLLLEPKSRQPSAWSRLSVIRKKSKPLEEDSELFCKKAEILGDLQLHLITFAIFILSLHKNLFLQENFISLSKVQFLQKIKYLCKIFVIFFCNSN